MRVSQCSPQALLAYRPIRLRYCKRIGRYPLVSIVSVSADIPSVDPGSNSVESFFFFLFFFPLLFFFSLSLAARWFNTYQIPILFLSSFSFFPSLAFFPPFLSSSNFPLAFLFCFFLLFFSHSIPSSCFLFSSPFYCFSFSLSSLSSFLPPPCPNACPTPPLLLQKILGRTLG